MTRRGPRPGGMGRRSVLAAAVAAGAAAGVAACSPAGSAGPDASGSIGADGASPAGGSSPPGAGATTESAAPQSATAGVTTPTATATRNSTAPASSSRPPIADRSPSGPAVEIGHGPRTVPAVALTFHGSGDPDLARALLDIVRQADARITVLVVGTWLMAQPTMADAILGAGHELGNHTLHHLPMKTLPAAKAATEIAGCQAVLRKVTGSGQRWFRASGTQHTTPVIRAAAGRAGYAACLSYDVDGLDWQDPPAATVVSAVLDNVRPGSIVSLHLGHRVTLTALPAILTGLRKQSLQPVSCSQLLV